MKRVTGAGALSLTLAALLLFFAFHTPASASGRGPHAAELDAARARLAQKAATIESIQSDFVQNKHLSIFSEVVVSKGRMAFKRPDSLRWELVEPVSTGFVLAGKKGRRWHELQKGQSEFDARRDPVLGAVAEQLIAWASADFALLEKSYLIELTSPLPAAFKLTPHSDVLARYLEAIEVAFSQDESHVAKVTVRERGGDYTEMLFGNVRINQALPSETF